MAHSTRKRRTFERVSATSELFLSIGTAGILSAPHPKSCLLRTQLCRFDAPLKFMNSRPVAQPRVRETGTLMNTMLDCNRRVRASPSVPGRKDRVFSSHLEPFRLLPAEIVFLQIRRDAQVSRVAGRGVSTVAFWGLAKSVASSPHAAAKDNHNPGTARFPVT
jgi:hypothetical protein